MSNNDKIQAYHKLIIGKYQLENDLTTLTYTRNKLALEEFSVEGLMKLQQIETLIERLKATIAKCNDAIELLQNELFNNDVISQAETILNGGNL